MSLIQQNVFVFNASIRENVTLFREFPEAELEDAMRRANLDALIQARGADFLCGENGKNLSGGEKQRVSIARRRRLRRWTRRPRIRFRAI